MFVAISSLRVANDMSEDVARAFRDRARLVDEAPGFLGLEVLVDRADRSRFELVTRWTDEAAFDAWHDGPDHAASHRRMPRGLKIEKDSIRLRRLDALDLGPVARSATRNP